MKNLIIAFLILTCLLALQCGLLDPESPTGSLRIVLIPERSDNNGLKKTSETLDNVQCIVNKGSKEIYNSNLNLEGSSFNAEIKDLEPGSDYSVLLYGKGSNNSIIARGYKSGVNVKGGKQETVNIVWASFSPNLISPTNASTINNDLPDFDWNDVNDATEYNLEIDDVDNFSSPNLSKEGITTSNYKVNSSLANDEYYWRVRAKDGQNNWGKWSDVWSITISVGTVTAPTFDPSPGTFPTAQNVIVNCATSGATIYYTTNGSDPSESDPVITGGSSIHIANTITLKARAFKNGWTPSEVVSGIYSITGTVETPTFDPASGTYSTTQDVTISCLTSNAIIHYTTNGADPSESDPIYSSPVHITTTTLLKARAFKSGWEQSSVKSGNYTITGTIATPTFSPYPGTYSTAQDVTISCATSGTSIHFTTDGSDPTDSDPVITSGNSVHISSTTTLKAKAYKTGWTPSSIASGSYIITGKINIPTFSPSPGTYSTAQAVTINCATSSASIYYTTNGSDPTESDEIYSSPVQISTTTTLKARAFKSGWEKSDVVSGTYTISGTVATPTFDPGPRIFITAQDVTISCATSGAIIHYTLDNSEPTESSSVYSNPIHIANTTTLKARAFKSGWTPSSIVSGSYTITGTIATPTFGPSPGTYTTAQDVTINCTTSGANIHYTTNGSDPTESDPVYSSPIHIAVTTTLKAKAFRINWASSNIASGEFIINIPTGLVAYYPFNNNANDESGNNNHLSAMNGVTPATDRFGNSNSAYNFDGIDDYLISPANNILDNYQTGAISVWIKPFSTTGNSNIFSYNTDENTNSLYNFMLADDSLRITYKYEGQMPHIDCSTNILQNYWYHFVFVADGNEMTKFYINGVKQDDVFGLLGTEANGSEWFADIWNVNTFNHFIIVGAYKRQGTLYDNGFRGMIDDIRIYNYAINETEISDLYKEGGWSDEDPYKDMVYVPAGNFTMGSNSADSDEQPAHAVYLDAFYIDKYEVTNAKYAAYLTEALSNGEIQASSSTVTKDGKELIDLDDGCQISYSGGTFVVESGKENYPLIEVPWYGAKAYAEHYGKRLPTEAEWEYAARGGSQSLGYSYSGSNNVDDVAWYFENSTNPDNPFYNGKGTHIVGTKQPNELSIYDMSGNVWEWCNDWYDANYYSSSPTNNPQGPQIGNSRVLRGGSWDFNEHDSRIANRLGFDPDYSNHNRGFRCVR